ncbi:hypothetical protein AB990_11810 [Alkalihalobacillus pseudalcaliphilus]|nr:hypothetical protein AB990_11810 [Alkalihalobacillus pseudalcaliphilus]
MCVLATILGISFGVKGPSIFLFLLLGMFLIFLSLLNLPSFKKYFLAIFICCTFATIGLLFDYSNDSVYEAGAFAGWIEILKTPKVDGNRVLVQVKTEQGESLQLRSYVKVETEQFAFKQISAGDRCYVEAILVEPSVATNFYSFNYKEFLYYQRTHWILEANAPSLQCIERQGHLIQRLETFRQEQMYRLEAELDTSVAGMIIALLFGERMFFEEEILTAYQRLGVFHLLAISGLHVGFIFSAIYFLLIRIGIPKERAQVTIMCLLPIYMILAGAAPPVVRACCMTFIVFLSLRLKRRLPSFYIITFVFMLYLGINPYALFQLGFQLSFLISFGLIISSQTINARYPNYLSQLVIVSALAQLLSFPFMLYHFFEQSWLQIPLNLVYIPFISLIILPYVFFIYLTGFVWPFLSGWLLEGMIFVLSSVHSWLIVVEGWDFHYMTFGKPSLAWLIVLTILIALLLLAWEKRSYRYTLASFLIGISALGTFLVEPYLNKITKITMIDVGQGDSFLIELPRNRGVYLIDTGGTIRFAEEEWKKSRSQFEVGADVVVPFLKAKGIQKIDKLIISHGDYDHAGGAMAVMDKVKVIELMYPKGELDDGELALFSNWKYFQPELSFVEQGFHWSVGDAHFYVLSPTAHESGRNDRSIVLFAEIEGYRFLFTGDIEESVEKHIIRQFPNLEADFLKVGHHGSLTSSTQEFLEQVKPKVALVSAGRNNRFGHPHPQIVERMEKQGIFLYRTDLDGAVKILLNDGEITIETMLKEEER